MNPLTPRLRVCTFVILLFLAFHVTAQTQQSKKEKAAAEAAATKNLIDSKNYLFEARSTTPSCVKFKRLSYGYYVKISGDTLISNLPFFGKSTAPTLPSENNGISFTSINFEYKVEQRKKGGWDIIAQPKDYGDIQKMIFTVFENANASLQVISQSRSAISYSGYITAPKQK